MVTKFLPLPANSGGKQRSLAVARRLAQRAEVTLCAYDDGTSNIAGLTALDILPRGVPWSKKRIRAMRGAVSTGTISAGRFWSPELIAEVRAASVPQPDVLLIAYSQLAFLLPQVPATRKVLDLHNVESSLMSSYAQSQGQYRRLLAEVESRALRRLEARSMGLADAVIVVSERDRQRLPGVPRRVLLCPNGCETVEVPPPPAAHPVAVFVALMNWAPNVDGAVWLAREVWPMVVEQEPSARLLLVGRDPAPAVKALAGSHVEVTGSVPDVVPYLARSRVALAPLRAGGGTRLKILEALAAARPVVATTVGAEGLDDLVGEGLVIADEPHEMAGAIIELLADPRKCAKAGLRGRQKVLERYRWDRTLEPMLDWLGRRPSRA